MADFEIIHNRKDCIGCGMCAGLDKKGDYWKMDADGKSILVGGKETAPGSGVYKRTVKGTSDEDLVLNKNIVEACPVRVIKVIVL